MSCKEFSFPTFYVISQKDFPRGLKAQVGTVYLECDVEAAVYGQTCMDLQNRTRE